MTTTVLGTTNKDKPFAPGERIDYCDEHYTVVANHGNSGTVKDTLGNTLSPFYWSFDGVACTRIE